MNKFEFDNGFFESHGPLIGLDEAGRGPIAGPVCAAAVFIDNIDELRFLCEFGDDSKAISEKEREKRFLKITDNFRYEYSFSTSEDIDIMNIFQATAFSMGKCVKKLGEKNHYGYSIVDGKNFKFNFPFECIIKGDAKSALIGAASIIAKYMRDQYMIDLSKKHPEYLFEKHKGYPTAEHTALVQKHGIFDEYRITFNPVKEFMITNRINFDKNEFSMHRLLKIGIL